MSGPKALAIGTSLIYVPSVRELWSRSWKKAWRPSASLLILKSGIGKNREVIDLLSSLRLYSKYLLNPPRKWSQLLRERRGEEKEREWAEEYEEGSCDAKGTAQPDPLRLIHL